MAWRDVLTRIVSEALSEVMSCEGDSCSEALAAAAAAVYAPLAPIDAGSGELKRLASRLAGILAHAYAYRVLGAAGGEADEQAVSTLRSTAEAVSKIESRSVAKKLLEKLGLGFEPVEAEEPKHAVVHALMYYVQAYEEAMQAARRRRRQPRLPSQQDAVRNIRRLLREIGRMDPFLARSLTNELRSRNLPV